MASRSRNARSEGALDPALPQKKRARRRLVGAAAVCLAAAIILPIVLDSEPRQIRDDVQVQIPSRDTPLGERNSRNGLIVNPGEGASASKADAQQAQSEAQAKAGNQGKAEQQADAASKAAPEAPSKAESQAKAEPKSKPEPQAKADPQAKPEPQAAPAAQSKPDGYVVQIGAFASTKGVTDQVERARKAGFKAYTEKLATPQGERTRVRVGPFATRDAADAARAKLRAAGIESTLISPDR